MFALATFYSCSDNGYDVSNPYQFTRNTDGDIIFQKRKSDAPKVTTKDILADMNQIGKTRSFGENGEIVGNSDALLGYSYTIGSSITGDFNNVKYPIVNIEKVKTISQSYITSNVANRTVTDVFAYTDFQRYINASSVTKKVSSGFRFKIGPFSFGRKKKTEETFSMKHIDSTKVVYGELSLKYPHASYSMNTIEAARKRYTVDCMDQSFTDNIFNSTIGNVIDVYGEYVLTGYITGGKAFALYAAQEEYERDIISRERNMHTIINASFSGNTKKDSANSDKGNSWSVNIDSLIFGKKNSNFSDSCKLINTTDFHLELFGGQMSGNIGVDAVKLANLNLDLTNWRTSLNETKNHTIIDILDGGICPLSGFMLEKNFKERYEQTINGAIQKRSKLITPKIEICRYYVRSSAKGVPLYDIAAVLYTRQGDRIVLRTNDIASIKDEELAQNENDKVFESKANEIQSIFKKYFELDILTKKSARLNPNVYNDYQGCIIINFRFNNMYKYTNPKSGVEYIYYNNSAEPKNKYAFSFYTDDWYGDIVIDTYLMRNLTDPLPERAIPLGQLVESYTIIGL